MQQPAATRAAWSEHVACMSESSANCSAVQDPAGVPNGAPKGAGCLPQKSPAQRPCIAVVI